ncbi:hypothetical protein EW146_g8356, partial [Bondarzewia mesenterica]
MLQTAESLFSFPLQSLSPRPISTSPSIRPTTSSILTHLSRLVHKLTMNTTPSSTVPTAAAPAPPTALQATQLAINALPTSPRPLTSLCPRPIPNSYWATPLLLACEYPWSPYCFRPNQKLDVLLQAGVRTFIDLTESGELSSYAPHLAARVARASINVETVEYHSFPIHDRSLPESVDYVYRILRVLRDNERR